MKIASFVRPDQDGVRVGIVDDAGDEKSIRDAGTDLHDRSTDGEVFVLDDVQLAAPVPRPGKIVCVGLNYRDHAEESGQPIPISPILFAKFANTVVGPGAAIKIPSITDQVDYEAELGVVIGKLTRGVSEANALDHVLGYTCINDVSARDIQLGDGQWVRGKTLDTFCPMGPWIVTTDEITDPQTLGIRAVLNGDALQDSTTAQMIFSVAELVSFISQAITLEPGDVIATGTPPGVGFARTPAVFLKAGDVIDVEIDGIGTLRNPVE